MTRRTVTAGALLPTLLVAFVAPAAPVGSTERPATRRTWDEVQEAMVLDALEGDPAREAERWERIVRSDLAADDPSLAEALMRLAEARWEAGDVPGAREALDRCVRAGLDRVRCADQRARVDLEVEGVHAVPVHWSFDASDHGFFHPRPFWPKGSIRLGTDREAGGLLAWTTSVDAVSSDELVVGFRDPTPEPSLVRFRVRSLELPVTLGLELVDTEGRRYAPRARPTPIPARTWSEVTLRVADVVPVSGEGTLRPRALYRLVVRDLTGVAGHVGRNELQIDDFEVR